MKLARFQCANSSVIALKLALSLVSRVERVNWYFKVVSGGVFERAFNNKRVRTRSRALTGISISIKELLLFKNGFIEASSMILSGFVSAYDSEVVTRLKRAGASILYKTNMDELGIGCISNACAHGHIINVWARTLFLLIQEVIFAGGSSGGAANAVAIRLCTAALATDTGGSVRQPANYVGVVGLKPSYGRCSRWGVLAYASSLDQVGVLTRNVFDLARVCSSIFGVDPKDYTSVSLPTPKYELYLGDVRAFSAKALILKQHTPCTSSAWTYCLSALARAGFELVDAQVPLVNMVIPCYTALTSVECYSNLAKYDGIKFGLRFRENDSFLLYKKLRTVAYSPEVKRKLLTGAYVLSTRLGYERYYLKAQALRFTIKSCLLKKLCNHDVLVSPSAPMSKLVEGYQRDFNILSDVYTVLANLTGLPSINVPICFGCAGAPFGVQLVASAYNELKLITLGAELMRACGVLSLCR
ncbi:Glutamyl-tRNA(Gln) amidotransferase subunit A [Candidatus Hodgkinia cicadicola]|nr:Glutamyl-tRNA(Gln) amidotransferase subunit A [Candidatus Hodgkinia cicadicola]